MDYYLKQKLIFNQIFLINLFYLIILIKMSLQFTLFLFHKLLFNHFSLIHIFKYYLLIILLHLQVSHYFQINKLFLH